MKSSGACLVICMLFCNRVLVVRARGGARSARCGPWAQGRDPFFNETSFGRCVQFRSLVKSSGACLVICMLFCNRVLVVRARGGARSARCGPWAQGRDPFFNETSFGRCVQFRSLVKSAGAWFRGGRGGRGGRSRAFL